MSVAALIAFVKLTGMPYEHYMRQTQIIDFLLGLSVVALGYVLHDQIYNIRGNVILDRHRDRHGSAVGSERRADRALDGSRAGRRRVARAQIGHDGHRAVAVGQLGRHSALTSVVVIVVGVFGGIVGPWVLRKVGVESRVAKGLAMGAAAHAMGTAAQWNSAPSRERSADWP